MPAPADTEPLLHVRDAQIIEDPHDRGVVKLSGGQGGTLGIRIVGQPLGDGGVSMAQSMVTLGPPGRPTLYTGRVTSLQGTHLAASVRGSDGAAVSLQIDISIDQANQTVAGAVQGSSV